MPNVAAIADRTTKRCVIEPHHDDERDHEHDGPERVVDEPRDPRFEHDPLEEDETDRGLDRAFDRARPERDDEHDPDQPSCARKKVP